MAMMVFVRPPPRMGEMNPMRKPQEDMNAKAAPTRLSSIPSISMGMVYITGIHMPLPTANTMIPAMPIIRECSRQRVSTRTPASLSACPAARIGLRLPVTDIRIPPAMLPRIPMAGNAAAARRPAADASISAASAR